jgi:hypothetical protein
VLATMSGIVRVLNIFTHVAVSRVSLPKKPATQAWDRQRLAPVVTTLELTCCQVLEDSRPIRARSNTQYWVA